MNHLKNLSFVLNLKSSIIFSFQKNYVLFSFQHLIAPRYEQRITEPSKKQIGNIKEIWSLWSEYALSGNKAFALHERILL